MPILTLSGFEDGAISIIFNDSVISEHALLIAHWVYGTPLLIDCNLAEMVNIILEKTNKINLRFNNKESYKIKLTQHTIDELQKDPESFKAYPIIKEAIEQQKKSS